MRRQWKGLMVLVGLAVVLVGCGGSEGDSTAASLPTLEDSSETATASEGSEAASEVADEDAALAFAQCMRDNGVEDFTDPTFGADGNLAVGVPDDNGGAAFFDDPDFADASTTCEDLLADVGFAPDEADQAELQDQLVAFTECLRDQGLDVDDPQFGTGGGPPQIGEGGPFADQIDPDDPDQAAALERCQDEVGLQPPGGN